MWERYRPVPFGRGFAAALAGWLLTLLLFAILFGILGVRGALLGLVALLFLLPLGYAKAEESGTQTYGQAVQYGATIAASIGLGLFVLMALNPDRRMPLLLVADASFTITAVAVALWISTWRSRYPHPKWQWSRT